MIQLTAKLNRQSSLDHLILPNGSGLKDCMDYVYGFGPFQGLTAVAGLT